MIDWAATGIWMQAWAGFAGAIAIGAAALIGRSSFDSWLRQRQTERKLEVGERVLTFAYRAKAAFSAVRSPGQFGWEAQQAEQTIAKDHLEAGAVDRRRLTWSVVIVQRLNEHSDLWTELFECQSLARIFFGAEMERAVQAFWEQRTRVLVAAQMYAGERPADFISRCEREMWEGAGDVPGLPGDEVAAAVRAAFDAIEGNVLPLVADRRPNRR